MPGREFNYRSPNFRGGPLVLALFGAPFVGVGLYTTLVGGIPINGQPATRLQDALFGAVFGVAGLGVWAWATRLWLTWRNERIEISESQVVWSDWRGRERLRCARDPSRGVSVARPNPRGAKYIAKFPAGQLEFSNMLGDFVLLKLILELPATDSDPAAGYPSIKLPKPKFVPQTQTFSYRFGALYIFSFVWIALILTFAIAFAIGGFAPRPGAPVDAGFAALFLGVLALFLLIGVWMQLTGWNERIDLGPSGIEWTDFRGQSKVRASIDDILDVDEASNGNASWLKITTAQGVVQASSNLRGYSELRAEVQHVVSSRALT